MRRFAVLIPASLMLVTGCETAGPLDPPAAAPSVISASVQNDSTPSAQDAATAEAGDGGILIGSGT